MGMAQTGQAARRLAARLVWAALQAVQGTWSKACRDMMFASWCLRLLQPGRMHGVALPFNCSLSESG